MIKKGTILGNCFIFLFMDISFHLKMSNINMRNDYRRTIIGQIFHIIKTFQGGKIPLLLVVIYYQASDRKGTENGIHHFCKAYFCGRPHILSSISTFLDLCRWHCSIYLPHRNISEFLQCTMYIVHVNILRFAYFLQHMYTYLCKYLCTCLSLYLCSISSIFVISGPGSFFPRFVHITVWYI